MRVSASPPLPSARFVGTAGVRSRRLTDRLATAILWGMAISIIVMLALFVFYMLFLGARYITPGFLFGLPGESSEAGGGIGPEIFNSFYILTLTLLMTVPIAVSAGVYIQEYARPGRFRALVQFSAEALATVPSIVMGLFGLLIFIYFFHLRFSAIVGAMTLTLLNLPALMRVTQEAMRTVPDSLREASMSLGATKWQTVTKAVMPSAIGPMTTGVVLIAGRIFGETAALIYTAGLSVSANSPYDFSLTHSAETLAVHLWYTRSESLVPDVDRIGNGSALVLLFMVLVFNVAARVLGRFLSKRLTGKSS